MSGFLAIKVSIIPHWGYSFRRTMFSKTRDSYLLPPPTTLIGALAYGLSRIRKTPEEILKGSSWVSSAERLRKHVISVNVKVDVPLHHHSDLGRIWWYRVREHKVKFDAIALGKAYSSPTPEGRVYVVYVLNEEGVKSEGLSINELGIAAYSITRLGSKESLVSVDKVCIDESPKYVKEEVVHTDYSFWLDLVDNYEGEVVLQEVIDFRKTVLGDYTGAQLRIHAYPYSRSLKKSSTVKATLRRGGRALRVCGEVVIIE